MFHGSRAGNVKRKPVLNASDDGVLDDTGGCEYGCGREWNWKDGENPRGIEVGGRNQRPEIQVCRAELEAVEIGGRGETGDHHEGSQIARR